VTVLWLSVIGYLGRCAALFVICYLLFVIWFSVFP